MTRVRLIHWNEDEGLARQQQLEALGFDTAFDSGDATQVLRAIRAGSPDAVVIDLSRLPSHGREMGRVLPSSKGFVDGVKPVPAKVAFSARADTSADLLLCFIRSARELQAHLLTLRDTIDRQTLWMIWPKKASGVKSDLDGNVVRKAGLAAGWVDVKVCAIDATWSGLAVKRRS